MADIDVSDGGSSAGGRLVGDILGGGITTLGYATVIIGVGYR